MGWGGSEKAGSVGICGLLWELLLDGEGSAVVWWFGLGLPKLAFLGW